MEIENSTTVNCDNNKYNCILEYFSKNGLKLYDDLETKKNCNEIYEILINDIVKRIFKIPDMAVYPLICPKSPHIKNKPDTKFTLESQSRQSTDIAAAVDN